MKYLVIYGTWTHNQTKLYIVFDIKGVTKNEVKHYINRFYSELRLRDHSLNDATWDFISSNVTRFYDLFSIKNEDLKDTDNFLRLRRYIYFNWMYKLEKEDLSTEFLAKFPELTIL